MLTLNGVNRKPPWWLAGGISPADMVGAWQGVGAASKADSYVNLANPGVYDMTEGLESPIWSAHWGWKFYGSPDRYLTLPAFNLNYTIIVKWRAALTYSDQSVCLFGNLASGFGTFFMPLRYYLTLNEHWAINGTNDSSGVKATSYPHGVVAMAGNKVYIDGVDDGVTLTTGTLPSIPMYLGRLNFSSSFPFAHVYVQAVAIYNRVLTATEVAAVTNALNETCQLDADVFFIVGQSNAAGYLTNNQACTSPYAWMFGKDYILKPMQDPCGTASGALETTMQTGAAYGSIYPLVADQIVAATGRPVVFCNIAVSGKNLKDYWMPPSTVPYDLNSGDGIGGGNHFACLWHRWRAAQEFGTPRAILAWCGEGEVMYAYSQAVCNTAIDTFADAAYAAMGMKTMFCKVHDVLGDETNYNAAVAEAWSDNANVLQGPDLHDLISDDDWHLKTDGKGAEAAARWATAIKNTFGW